jgi:hypothetical protein
MPGLDPGISWHERFPWFRLRISRREITGSSPIRANTGQKTWWELWNIVMARLGQATTSE